MEVWDEVFSGIENTLGEDDTYAYIVSNSGKIIYMFSDKHLRFPNDRSYYSAETLLYVKRSRGHLMKAFVSGYIERYVRGSFAFPEQGSQASRRKRLYDANKMGKIDVIMGRLLQKVRRERTYTTEEVKAILGLKEDE